MFILTTISDLIQISPVDFQKPSAQALEDNINAKYANKVIQNVGLCICMYDLLKASEGLIGHGTGLVNVNVEFRMVVFRPFKGEVMLAKISSSSSDGIKYFFNDIFIPGDLLFPGSEFDHIEQVWIWDCEGSKLYFDKNEPVYFRVESEEWNDQSPVAPSERIAAGVAGTDLLDTERKSPYIIHGSMAQSGLGVCMWW